MPTTRVTRSRAQLAAAEAAVPSEVVPTRRSARKQAKPAEKMTQQPESKPSQPPAPPAPVNEIVIEPPGEAVAELVPKALPVTRHRGRDTVTVNGRRYELFGKPFRKLVNKDRKEGRRTFTSAVVNGITYIPNPLISGQGSQDAFVGLDLDKKREKARLATLVREWEDRQTFVVAGREYLLSYDAQFSFEHSYKNGVVRRETRQIALPAAAERFGRDVPEFTSARLFKPRRNMTRDEVVERMNEILSTVLAEEYIGIVPENVKTLSLTVSPVSSTPLSKVRMGSVKYFYSSIDNNATGRPGECVRDYILTEFAKADSRRQGTLRTQVPDIHTTEEIIAWARTYTDITVYALDPTWRVFDKHVATDKARVWLMFMVNNGHCYPITNESQRRCISATGRLDLQAVEFDAVNMEEVVYFEHDNTQQDVSVDDALDFIASATTNVVLPLERLDAIAAAVIEQTKHNIEHFNYYNHMMTSFMHPTKNIVIIAGRDFPTRRALCQLYFEKHRVAEFKWANQPWGKIGRLMFDSTTGSLPSSHYNHELQNIFVRYPIRPYKMCADKSITRFKSIDTKRCYTAALLNNAEPWNVFGMFDYPRKYVFRAIDALVPGEYYIAKDFFMGRGTIFVSRGFYPMAFIKHALCRGYVTGNDLTYAIFADRHLPADTFKAFADCISAQFPEESKLLINFMIGCFGSLYARKTSAGVSCDAETAVATALGLSEDGHSTHVHQVGNLFIVQQLREMLKDRGDYPIYRQIIASSLVNLDNMVESLDIPGSSIVGYNTDAVKFVGSYNKAAVRPKDGARPGEYHLEPPKPMTGRSVEEQLRHEAYEFSPVHVECEDEPADGVTKEQRERLLSTGGLVLGVPGGGKTWLLRQLYHSLSEDEKEKTAVLTYTNAGSVVIQEESIKSNTISSALMVNGHGLNPCALQHCTRVIIDEFTMVPPAEMGAIVKAWRAYGFTVLCFGDPDQCKAPVDNWVAYDKNPVFLQMCGRYTLRIKYKPALARYDTALYDALMTFKATSQLDWACDEVESYTNIVARNTRGENCRDAVNKRCLERWVREHDTKLVTCGFPVCVGLPVMCYDDKIAELGMFKTQKWTVTAVSRSAVTLCREDKMHGLRTSILDAATFKRVFNYSFAFTPGKCQGMTLEGHYNIYGAELMSKDELYTALSRGRKREYVHVVRKRNHAYVPTWRKVSIPTTVATVKLHQGLVYRIEFADGKAYIGQTVKPIQERFLEHINTPTNKMMAARLTGCAVGEPTNLAYAATALKGGAQVAQVRAIESFTFVHQKTLDDAERACIAKALAKGTSLLNRQHNKPTAQAAPAAEAAGLAKAPERGAKLRITADAAKRRYEIRFQSKGTKVCERFPWGADKDAALAAAEQRRTALLEKYF